MNPKEQGAEIHKHEWITEAMKCPRCGHIGLDRVKDTWPAGVFLGDSYYCPACLGSWPVGYVKQYQNKEELQRTEPA